MEEQMLSRRQFLTLVGSSAAVGLLAACAPATPMAQPAGEPAQAAEAATAAKGKVRLAFWVEWQQPFYEEFLRAFNEEYDDMQLEFVVVEGLGGDSSGKFMAAVAGGNPPDALLAWADSLPGWAARKALLPMGDAMATYGFKAEEYAPASIKASTWAGAIYGWPLDWDPDCMLYWNKDLFAGAGLDKPPETLEELWPLRDKFDKLAADGSIEQVTLVPWDGWYFNCFALAHQFGSKLYDAETREIMIDSPGMKAALEYEKMWADHYGYEKVGAFASGVSAATQSSIFGAGRAALYMCGDWVIPGFARNNPDLVYDIERLPIAQGREYFHCGSGWPWMTPRGVKDFAQSVLAVSRLMTRERVLTWCQSIGWQPAWLPPRDDPSWAKVDPHWPKVFEIVKGFESSTWLEPSPIATAFWNEVKNAENMVLTGQMSIGEALAIAQKNVEQARDEALAEGKFG
jgi:ABC-type glycerol-3-phosphate transport system substrate-binding protein